MAKISSKAQAMPASAIRKLVPLADAAKANGTKVYHLNVGQPDIKSPQCALEAVRNNTLDHVSYTNSAGMIELRQGLVEKYYNKIGIDLTVPEILVTVAGSEAVDVALQVTCDAGDELIVMEPYYTNYNTFCFMNGITLKAVHTDIREGFSVPDMARFEELITPRTKAILISNPGNPTGTLYTKEQMLALGEIARKHDLFLISDEVYREFCYTDEPHFSAMNIPGLEQNVILIDSVSKRYNLCGCRVGCIASHNKEVMAAVLKYAQARLCPPVYGQLAALGALDTPDSYFAAVREEYIRRRDAMVDGLNAIPGVYSPRPMGAFYTVAEMPVDDGERFAFFGFGRNHVRIAYVLEVPKIKRALHILEEGLKAYPGRI